MQYLKRLILKLDVIFARLGIFVILVIIPYLIISRCHYAYYIALFIGFICIGCYLIFKKKLFVLINESKVDYWILGIAFIMGLSQVWIVNLMFPNSLIGLDTWTHMRITTQELDIALSGNSNSYGINQLTPATIGGYFTVMHLYLKSMMDIFGLNYKWTSLIFVGSVQLVGIIVFVYLIGKELISRQVGSIASLLVANASWVIYFTEWVIPNGIGALFSLITAYLFIKAYKTNRYDLVWYSLILVVISLLLHIMVALWVVGTMICICLITENLDMLNKRKYKGHKVSNLIPLISLILLLAWYQFTTIGNAITVTSNDMESMTSFGQEIQYQQSIVEQQQIAVQSAIVPIVPIIKDVLNNGNLIEILIDGMGFFLYFGIAVIGCLMMLKSTNLNKSWSILCLGTLFIGFFPALFEFQVLKERWWYLGQVFMAIPLAVMIKSINKKVIMCGVIVAIVFLSIIGLPSNITNRAFSQNLIVRYAFTSAELSTRDNLTIEQVYQNGGILGADSYYIAYIQSDIDWYWPQRTKVRGIDEYILSGNFKDCPYGIILIREALYNEPFAFGNGSIYKIEYNVLESAKQQGYKELWQKGGVHCLIRK